MLLLLLQLRREAVSWENSLDSAQIKTATSAAVGLIALAVSGVSVDAMVARPHDLATVTVGSS